MTLDILKEKIAALEMGRANRRVLPLGLEEIDVALQGGLDLGAIHEFTGPAAFLFIQMIIRRRKGTIFWLCEERAAIDYNAAALLQYGGEPEHFLAVYLQSGEDVLKAAYEVLASKAAGCVVIDLRKALNQTQARKLQLAVQETSTLGMVVNMAAGHEDQSFPPLAMVSSVVTRWHVRMDFWSQEKTRLSVSLTKNRRGQPRHWNVEIDHATHHLYLASPAGKREIDPGRIEFGT